MARGKSNNKKLVGIVSAAILLILGVLLQQGVIVFNSGPDLRITEAYPTSSKIVNYDIQFRIEIFNQGNKVAENCNVLFDQNISDDADGIWSGVFNVKPNEGYQLEVPKIKYDTSGKFMYETYVKCENYPQSKSVSYSIEIES